MSKSNDVHHGEIVSLYLKNKRPLPKWAELKVFPRSGSTSTWWSVFVPSHQRIDVTYVDSQDKYFWSDVNGIIYNFRYQKDAEAFLEDLHD